MKQIKKIAVFVLALVVVMSMVDCTVTSEKIPWNGSIGTRVKHSPL